jgi:FtsH-binding integral membrane protein
LPQSGRINNLMAASSRVFDRSRDPVAVGHQMSKNTYALSVSVFTFLGIGVSFVASLVSHHWQVNTTASVLELTIGCLIVGIAGIMISLSSDDPFVSMLGFTVLAIAFGIMLGPILNQYKTVSVVECLALTTAIVAAFGVLGAVIPGSLEGFGSYVLGALLVLIVCYFFVPLAHFFGVKTATALTWVDWLGVLVFCGIVVYDWNRAMRLPRTLDNAVDSAVAVYLDFVNIFIRLLQIIGGQSTSK